MPSRWHRSAYALAFAPLSSSLIWMLRVFVDDRRASVSEHFRDGRKEGTARARVCGRSCVRVCVRVRARGRKRMRA
eukprot:1113218-Pleurochrysis_carterae.AAC.1